MIGNSRASQRKNNTWPLQKTTNNSALIGCLIYDVEKRWGSVSTLLPALYKIIIWNIYKRYTERKNWIIISLLSFPWRGWESSILTFPRSLGEWVCININANELSRVDALAHTQVFFIHLSRTHRGEKADVTIGRARHLPPTLSSALI